MAQPRPKLSMYTRERVRIMTKDGFSTNKILQCLKNKNISPCRQTIWRQQKHIASHDTIKPLTKSGRPKKLTRTILGQIDNKMNEDDETTIKELKRVVENSGVSISAKTLSRGRRCLGWTRRGNAYCQMI